MLGKRLWETVSTFDQYDRSRFRKFLQSPYFNRDEELLNFYQELWDNGKKILEKPRQHWPRISHTTYKEGHFRRRCSDLLDLALQFLAQRRFDKDALQQNIYQRLEVQQRSCGRLYKRLLQKGQRLLERDAYRNGLHYLQGYRLAVSQHGLEEQSYAREVKANIEQIATQLDYFYLAEKLKYYCEVLNRQRVMSFEYEFLLMEGIVAHLRTKDYSAVPPIAIYKQVLLTLIEFEEERHYFELKDLLARFAEQFSPNEAKDMYSYAQNYCIRRINQGEERYMQEIFALYKKLLEQKIIWYSGELSPWDYKNIVVVALRVGDFDWAETFIRSFQSRLPNAYRENAFRYNLAKLRFYQANYDAVIQLLQAVEYQDIFYQLDSKAMLLQTYYELDEWEALDALVDSFRVYLQRKKVISEHHRRNYLNLTRFVRKLSRTFPGDAERLKALEEELAQTKAIANKSWLHKKLQDFA